MRAMVLCAGYGTRLGNLTQDTPKPMLPIQGQPLLAYILAQLRAHGFDEVAMNLHFRPEVVREYFGNGSRFGMKLEYFLEPRLLGTAGALRGAAEFLGHDQHFLIHYGDILSNQNFTAMLRFHRKHGAMGTLLVHARTHSNSLLMLDGKHRIMHFLERPDEKERQRFPPSPWVNSGVCLCERAFLDEIPTQIVADLPRDVFPKLAARGCLYAYELTGYRCAIDSPERLEEARADLASGRCRIPAE